jgi:hypothetical protein
MRRAKNGGAFNKQRTQPGRRGMKEDSLKLTGSVVKANADDQSFLIEFRHSSNRRLWVYADNKVFKKLNYLLLSARFNEAEGAELAGTFRIQGRVLKSFIKEGKKSLVERYPVLTALANREIQSK